MSTASLSSNCLDAYELDIPNTMGKSTKNTNPRDEGECCKTCCDCCLVGCQCVGSFFDALKSCIEEVACCRYCAEEDSSCIGDVARNAIECTGQCCTNAGGCVGVAARFVWDAAGALLDFLQ